MSDSRSPLAIFGLQARDADTVVALGELGFEIRHSSDVASVLEMLASEDVDLVVSDAGIDGVARIAKALRSRSATSFSLLVWVTATRDPALLDDATRLGVDHTQAPDALAAGLRQLLLAHRRRGWPRKAGELVEAQTGDVWALLDAIPPPIFYKDAQGRYLGCNRSFEEFIGTSREKLLGQSVYELSPAHLADKFFEADNALLAKGGTQVYEARVLRADGEERDVIFYKALFGTERVSGLVGTLLDITDRKQLEQALARERERAEALLRNVLPDAIAARLKERSTDELFADRFRGVTVVFADIVNFTPMSERMSSDEIVGVLDEVFSAFDGIAEAHGVEKIKTIGDAYMAAAGLPEPRDDHARAAAEFALEMRGMLPDLSARVGHPLNLRIGMNSGPVTAGVIGRHRFIYDLWGDVVNTASRMESHGVPGRIQVTEETRALLSGMFDFEARGAIDVKGKGRMHTYFLQHQA